MRRSSVRLRQAAPSLPQVRTSSSVPRGRLQRPRGTLGAREQQRPSGRPRRRGRRRRARRRRRASWRRWRARASAESSSRSARALTASEAAVWRSSCGVSPSRPAPIAARSKTSCRKYRFRNAAPRTAVKTRSSDAFPATCSARTPTSKRGTGTERCWWFFGSPHASLPRSSVTDSVTSMRRRVRSSRPTLSAAISPHRWSPYASTMMTSRCFPAASASLNQAWRLHSVCGDPIGAFEASA